jgi:hypothetical protein
MSFGILGVATMLNFVNWHLNASLVHFWLKMDILPTLFYKWNLVLPDELVKQ